jgi:hypothetical protein
MTKYIFCILACVFLVLGFSNVSHKELQEFQKETGISVDDMQYKAESCCRISSADFCKSCEESHSLFIDETSHSKVSDCIFDNISFPRSVVPFKNLKFNTNTVIIQVLSSLNALLSESRLEHAGLDVNYTKYSCKYYVYTLAHILI